MSRLGPCQRRVYLAHTGCVQIHNAVELHQIIESRIAVRDDNGFDSHCKGLSCNSLDYSVQATAVAAAGYYADFLDAGHRCPSLMFCVYSNSIMSRVFLTSA